MILKSFGLAAFIGLAVAACGDDDPFQSIDRSTDCAAICDKYQECIGGDDYDTDKCSDDCSDMKTDSQSNKIDACQDCIENRSCTNSVFNCTAECAGIVP
jgi:hypothetical protein